MKNREEPNLSLHREAMTSIYRFVPFCVYVCKPIDGKKYRSMCVCAHRLWRFDARCLTIHHGVRQQRTIFGNIRAKSSSERLTVLEVTALSTAPHLQLTKERTPILLPDTRPVRARVRGCETL